MQFHGGVQRRAHCNDSLRRSGGQDGLPRNGGWLRMSIQQVTRVWESVLGRIRRRSDKLLSDADTRCKALLAEVNISPDTLPDVWAATEIRALEIEEKITQAWIGLV